MSAISYASDLKCDYPDCESVAHVVSADEVPAGWLLLRGASMDIRTPYGMNLRDFCSIHAGIRLDMLAKTLQIPPAPSEHAQEAAR